MDLNKVTGSRTVGNKWKENVSVCSMGGLGVRCEAAGDQTVTRQTSLPSLTRKRNHFGLQLKNLKINTMAVAGQ